MLSTSAASDSGFSRTRITPDRSCAVAKLVVDAAADQDGRKRDLPRAQQIDQLEAVDVGHPVVDHQAGPRGQVAVRQKRRRTVVDPDAKTLHFEGELERRAHGGIVIDDKDGLQFRRHSTATPVKGVQSA